MTCAARPLDRFPLVRTQNVDEMCAAMEWVYTRPRLELPASTRKVDAALNYLPMNHIGLGYTTYGVDLTIAYPESHRVCQSFPIAGCGEVKSGGLDCRLDPGHGVVASPGATSTTRINGRFQNILLVMEPAALARKLSALTGQSIGSPIRCEPVQDYTRPAAKALREHVLCAVALLNAPPVTIPETLLAAFEESLAVIFLRANRHNYSHLLEGEAKYAAPWQVRRGEDYVAATPDEPMALEALTEVTGVSALSLLRSFKARHGCSPRQFIAQLRASRRRPQ